MNTRILNIKKGDKVIRKVEERSNASMYLNPFSLDNMEEWCKEFEVTKATKNYITLSDGMKFDINNDFRNTFKRGGADYKLYLSISDIIDEFRNADYKMKIEQMLKKDLDTDTLEKIYNILNGLN